MPQMIATMDETVAGLEKVKRRLAVTLRRFMLAAASGQDWQPQNLMIAGPTGGGKTWLLTHLLASIPVIWTETSATEYSDVGYHGRDLTEMYLPLVKNNKKALAERWGVVLFDEIDKIRVREDNPMKQQNAGGNDRQVGKILQYELLKLVEGVETWIGRGDTQGVGLKTHGILHIGMGAFQGIESNIARNHAADGRDDFHELMDTEDLIEYGFVPELVGRFATIVPLPPLRTADMIRILHEQIVPKWMTRAEIEGLKLEIDRGAVHNIANEATKHPLGARSLEPILDEWTWDAWSLAEPGQRIVLNVDNANRRHAELI